jgi:putative flippase GtrA
MPVHADRAEKLMQLLSLPRLLRFAGVGVLGLAVDVTVLYGMLAAGLDYVAGRLVSFAIAVTVTWYLNHKVTFVGLTSAPMLSEWARFVLANLAGAVVNFLTYLAIMRLEIALPGIAALAVAAGSLGGMMFNYTASCAFVFSRRSRASI